MSDWFITPKQKFYAGLLPILTIIFFGLMISSFFSGTPVLTKKYLESQFEKEEMKDELVGKFKLDSREVCMLEVKGLTLNQSWIWVKVLILDEKDRPVFDYKFNLSYYHGVEGGESWSEGDKEDHKLFILPKGNYKALVYGEDANQKSTGSKFRFKYSNGYSTIDRNESIQITVSKGIVLTRYYLTFFLIFCMLTIIYYYIRSERANFENPSQAYTSALHNPEPVYSNQNPGHPHDQA